MNLEVCRTNLGTLAQRYSLPQRVHRTYWALLEFVHLNNFRGACHATTAMLHVLLRSQGIAGRPCIGELSRQRQAFDHSWYELNGRVYDVAISLPFDRGFDGNPVFAGTDLVTLDSPHWTYGTITGLSNDTGAVHVRSRSFLEYADQAPYHRDGLWHLVEKVGRRLKLRLEIPNMRSDFAAETWEDRSKDVRS